MLPTVKKTILAFLLLVLFTGAAAFPANAASDESSAQNTGIITRIKNALPDALFGPGWLSIRAFINGPVPLRPIDLIPPEFSPQCSALDKVIEEHGCYGNTNGRKTNHGEPCLNNSGRCALKYESKPCFSGKNPTETEITHYFCDSEEFPIQCDNIPSYEYMDECREVGQRCDDLDQSHGGGEGTCFIRYYDKECYDRTLPSLERITRYECRPDLTPQCNDIKFRDRYTYDDDCTEETINWACDDYQTGELGYCTLEYAKEDCYIGKKPSHKKMRHYFCETGDDKPYPQCSDPVLENEKIVNEDGCNKNNVHEECPYDNSGECALKYEKKRCFIKNIPSETEVKHYYCDTGDDAKQPQCESLDRTVEEDGCYGNTNGRKTNYGEPCLNNTGTCALEYKKEQCYNSNNTSTNIEIKRYFCETNYQPQCRNVQKEKSDASSGCDAANAGKACPNVPDGTCKLIHEEEKCFVDERETTTTVNRYICEILQQPQCSEKQPIEEDGCTADRDDLDKPCTDQETGRAGVCTQDQESGFCFNTDNTRRETIYDHYFCDSGDEYQQPQCSAYRDKKSRIIDSPSCNKDKVGQYCTAGGSVGKCELDYYDQTCYIKNIKSSVEITRYQCKPGSFPTPQCEDVRDIETDECNNENIGNICEDANNSRGGGTGFCQITKEDTKACYNGINQTDKTIQTFECVPEEIDPSPSPSDCRTQFPNQCDSVTPGEEDGCTAAKYNDPCVDADTGLDGYCDTTGAPLLCYNECEPFESETTYSWCDPGKVLATSASAQGGFFVRLRNWISIRLFFWR